jgi:rSAM/selenodomain-associated transferase 2
LKISIIIPTLNEADRIGPQVGRCLALSPPPEVLVADGGSSDATLARARAAGARVLLASRRGRAVQMNEGAAAAGGDVFLFLHADVLFPPAAHRALLSAVEERRLWGGAFRRRFDSPSPLLAIGSRLADLRGRIWRLYLGDQAIFVRREAFTRLGGFPMIPLFEDLAFSRAMSRQGPTRLVPETVVASARRFEREGNLRRLLRNVGLTLRYFLGSDPERLARRYYPDYISPAPPDGSIPAAPGDPLGGRP